jgi:hypothetical protein
MQHTLTREAIQLFLKAAAQGQIPIDPKETAGPKRPPALNPDILELYSPDMEVQVNVLHTNAEPVEGKRNTWMKDGQVFWNIRVPKKAMSDPEWRDYGMKWSLTYFAEAIGMTGWDWVNRTSRFVAFDFDAITGHAPGVGVDEDKLRIIQAVASEIPWVQTRRSTRGGGLHLYVFFSTWNSEIQQWVGPGVRTQNHTEHAALGRCVLSMMSQRAGFNFSSAIDACGGNMWVWHLDATKDNEGFALLNDSSEQISEEQLPSNWKDHISVVTRKRTKIKISGVPDEEDGDFDHMASSRNIIALDLVHRTIIGRLRTDAKCSTVWVPEYNLLQTHTAGFARLMELYPDDYLGFFATNSPGTDLLTPNSFAFPMPSGGWKVYRFSQGHQEHESWNQDGKGYTSCYFNCRPDLESASLAMGGAEIEGGYQFDSLKHALNVAIALGADVSDLKDWADSDREAELGRVKSNGRLKMRVEKRRDEPKPGQGWVKKRNHWEKIFKVSCNPPELQIAEYPEFDNEFRAIVAPSGQHAGWAVWSKDNQDWDIQPVGNVKLMLKPRDFTTSECERIMGSILMRRWQLVSVPFQPEFPGNRQWNYKTPQLRYLPADIDPDGIPHHPHWDQILDHIGQDLDGIMDEDSWCERYGITTGRQYLQLWIASMLREPFQPLPYLFLYGPQNSGKSILHEAISRLITGGVCNATTALTTTGDHNGELAGQVLAFVEELNLSAKGAERARNRIKDWTTCREISIRQMRTDAYMQPNTLHFIQCSNIIDYCPIDVGDTRITMLFVPSLGPKEEIPKIQLMEYLENEASHFMHTLMDLEIPPVQGRLRIPILRTRSKDQVEELNRSSLDRFLEDQCHTIKGAKMTLADFFKVFQDYLPEDEKGYWTSRKVAKRLPSHQFPVGRSGGAGKTYVGNMSFSPNEETDGIQLILSDGRLRARK